MKDLGKKLALNKTTIDILDDSALQNVKGGAADAVAKSCGLSIACTTCNTTSEPEEELEAPGEG